MSERHIPEWLKNLLIILLSLSALLLLTRSPLYVDSPLHARIQNLLRPEGARSQTSISLTDATCPIRMAVVNDNGRYGVQYDHTAVDETFDLLGPLLGEALNTTGPTFPIAKERWHQALKSPGIYFDFGSQIPFSALSGWMEGGTVNLSLSTNVRRLILATGDEKNTVWLFWQDADTGAFQASTTDLDLALHFAPTLAAWLPNAALFAFEEPAYAACDPYTLITTTPTPAIYVASIPLSSETPNSMPQVLSALSYSPASVASYPTSDGTRYTAGDSTFLLTTKGTLFFQGADPFRSPTYDQGIEGNTAQWIETTRRLTADTLGLLCGEAQLYLTSARYEGEYLVITYGYRLNGIPVFLHEEGWAAQFVVYNGTITEFTLHFRSYAATSTTTPLLPEPQAAAAMSALEVEGGELLLSYRDGGGDTVTAGWAAS